MTNGPSPLSTSYSTSSSSSSSYFHSSSVSRVQSPIGASGICTPTTSVHSDDGAEYFHKGKRNETLEEFVKPYEKVPELWFEDGNLILQAENTIFRIYRGHLSARSSVFRDMFEFPPPAEGNRSLDGVPIVEVYDDAEDMKWFLKAVLDSEFFEPPPSSTTLQITHSILKLATKYDVRYLRLRALAHLQATYPTTLAAWKARDEARTIPSIENTPFAVLKVASEFGLDWLVPSIVYCISSHDIAKTLDGAPWGVKKNGKEGEEGVGKVELSWGEKRMCLNARNKLLLLQNAHSLSIVRHHRPPPTDDSPKCTGDDEGQACHQTRLRIADILTRWGTAGFLDFFDEQYEAFSGGLCDVCLEDFKTTHAAAVQELWDVLPRICGFEGGWRELERVRGLTVA